MARRIASLAGIVVLLALAVALLWRVYLHHHQADPYEREESITVELKTPGKNCGRFALNYSSPDTTEYGMSDAISWVRRSK